MRKLTYITLIILSALNAQTFSIARVHYSGGGDWYSDPSSIPNLLKYLETNTAISVEHKDIRVNLIDEDAHQYPFLYLTGHGNIRLTDNEVISLRSILTNNGFLHADDNYGMDASFRRELKRVFPNKELVPLPNDHPIFHSFYSFPNGLPKVHEHDGKPPQALALFDNNRMMVLYTYESDLGDGWEDASVHQDPWPIREAALQMGVNIIYYSLTQ
jgi:hypothetical protein|tara:strand:- start:2440 stop:3084 length:645 start_codon:yes stop_codon:yes gene_type:complete